MKANHTTSLAAAVFLASLLAGCSATSTDNKVKLEKLKEQRAQLDKEIQMLESEHKIANPGPVTVKSKEVGVSVLALSSFDYFVKTQGSVEAIDNIMVSAETMGILTAVHAREGQVVTKGQTLAQIDNALILRNIDELKSSISLARTVFERQKNLWDQKIGTEVQYLQAKNNKESLEKRLATLNEQLDMTRIKSPINGSVDEVDVKIGQNVAPGMPAFRVVSFDKLKMNANVSEAFVTKIKTGNKVKVSFPTMGEEIVAEVTFVGKTINRMSRTFPVEVALPSLAYLRPNMSGVLKVIFQNVPDALTIPVNVVQDINDEKVVYIAVADGDQIVARKKVITVAGVYDNLAQVSGLTVGDKLITVGYQGLNDGEFVKF
ncbi:MAG: efflux RND transporter periplasmic adaptor subunit [Cytophagales bacterium]|nr:efflux RND transporter periplasmic adaptor subunit [Cytophagales bacterium]